MINKIKKLHSRVRNSKDGKVLAGNFSYLMLMQFASYLFPLLTIPYLARVIGVDGFGKIAFAAAVIVWFKTITDWGFNYTATRDVAQNRECIERVSEIFSNVFWSRVFLMVVSFSILTISIILIPYFQKNKLILWLTFLMVPGHILFADWFFQAVERMKYITIFNLVSRAFFTLLVFVFINNEEDFVLQPLLLSSGYIVSGLISMYIIVWRWKVRLHAPRVGCVLITIKNSSDVFINNIMPNLYNSFSVVLLGFYGGSASNGLLDAGRKFVEIGQQFLMVISRVFFPFLSRKMNAHDLYAKLQIGLAVLFSLVAFTTAPWIINFFFTPDFYSAVPVLQIMSLSMVFLSLSNVYGTNYMIIKGYSSSLRNITSVVSLAGFVAAFPLIIFLDYIGAAITIAMTRGALGLAVCVKAKAIKKMESLKNA